MLFERWRQIESEHSHHLALIDLASGQRWTFRELEREAERRVPAEKGILFGHGNSPELIFNTLAAWRAGVPFCPLEKEHPIPQLPPFPARLSHLKITSATSGPAKIIAFTGSQLAADADNILTTMGLRPDRPNVGIISLAHSYGFSNLVLPLLLHGIPLILAPSPLPEILLEASRQADRITLPAVPALWKIWHESRSIPSNTALAITAGAPMPLHLEESIFRDSSLKVHNFYGSSECGGIAYDRSSTPRSSPSCAGTAMDRVQLEVAPEGNLIVQGSAVGETYWPEPSPALANGRFETQDLAEIRDGVVHLLGRASDVINVAGRKVSPETIEQALRMHPLVKECVVFGIPETGEGRFERIVACVALAEKTQPAALAAFLSEHIPSWQIPREWSFDNSVVPNVRGKISRARWRADYLRLKRSA